MNSELDFYFYAGMGIVPALIAFGVIWWRQTKQPYSLGVAKLGIVALVTVLTSIVAFVLFMVAVNASGYQSLDAFTQPFGIASGVVAYFIGNQVAVRLAKSATR